MIIDNVEYVKKEEFDELKERKDFFEDKYAELKAKYEDKNTLSSVSLRDISATKGFCIIEPDEDFRTTKIRIEDLKRIIQILEILGIRATTISVKNDFPIVFRMSKEDKTGLVIAPMVDNE